VGKQFVKDEVYKEEKRGVAYTQKVKIEVVCTDLQLKVVSTRSSSPGTAWWLGLGGNFDGACLAWQTARFVNLPFAVHFVYGNTWRVVSNAVASHMLGAHRSQTTPV
jgi:hypothetical protein